MANTDLSPLGTPWRSFEDLVVGETRRSETLTVTEYEIVTFAKSYDPQWFHTDPEAAKASVFGEVVASGIHVLALWRRLTTPPTGRLSIYAIAGAGRKSGRSGAAGAGCVAPLDASETLAWPGLRLAPEHLPVFGVLTNREESGRMSSVRVMIVEDEPLISAAMEMLVEELGGPCGAMNGVSRRWTCVRSKRLIGKGIARGPPTR